MALQHNSRGFGFIEIIVAVFVIGVGILAVSSLFAASLRIQNEERMRIRAASYLEEGMEAAKAARSIDWSNIPQSGTWYLDPTVSLWTFVSSDPGPLNGAYSRTITFSPAYRDGNGNLAVSGSEDADTRKVRVQVDWTFGGGPQTEFVEGYITHW